MESSGGAALGTLQLEPQRATPPPPSPTDVVDDNVSSARETEELGKPAELEPGLYLFYLPLLLSLLGTVCFSGAVAANFYGRSADGRVQNCFLFTAVQL